MRKKTRVGLAGLVAVGSFAVAEAKVDAHGGTYFGGHYGHTQPGVGNGFSCTGGIVPRSPSGPDNDLCVSGHHHWSGTCYVYYSTVRWGSTAIGGTYVGSYVC